MKFSILDIRLLVNLYIRPRYGGVFNALIFPNRSAGGVEGAGDSRQRKAPHLAGPYLFAYALVGL